MLEADVQYGGPFQLANGLLWWYPAARGPQSWAQIVSVYLGLALPIPSSLPIPLGTTWWTRSQMGAWDMVDTYRSL